MTITVKVIDKVSKEYVGTMTVLRKDLHKYEVDFQLIEVRKQNDLAGRKDRPCRKRKESTMGNTKKYVIMRTDECGDDRHVEDITVPYVEGFEFEEVAEMILDRKLEALRERWPEAQRFFIERKFSDMSYSELMAMASMFE